MIDHHLNVHCCVLERQYSYDENGHHTEDNGSENMIIHGDNLSALKSLLPQYEGRINCVYIVVLIIIAAAAGATFYLTKKKQKK